jgi:hypothetical protein
MFAFGITLVGYPMTTEVGRIAYAIIVGVLLYSFLII